MKDHRTPWAFLRYKDWTIEGEIQKIDKNAYTNKDGHGGQVRLHMEESALQGKSFREGDMVKANFKKGDETYTVLSTEKADQSSMHSQSQKFIHRSEET